MSATPRSTTATSNDGAVAGAVRGWLRAEGLGVLVAAAALYARTGRGWGAFAALFFAPDLALAAYALGPRAGAAAYNVAHSAAGPLLLVAAAAVRPTLAPLLAPALVWAAHVGFDRLLGYGLKYPDAFGRTHLGGVGARRA